jgi:hypothetical protein
MLSEIFEQPEIVTYLTEIFDAMHEKRGPNTWDYQWLFSQLKNNAIVAVSSVNLVTNIGFGKDATHTTEDDMGLMLPAKPMQFPLRHPGSFIPLRSIDRHRVQDMFSPSLFRRLSKKGRRIVARLFG